MNYEILKKQLESLTDCITLDIAEKPVYFPNHPTKPTLIFEQSRIERLFQEVAGEHKENFATLRAAEGDYLSWLQNSSSLRRLVEQNAPQVLRAYGITDIFQGTDVFGNTLNFRKILQDAGVSESAIPAYRRDQAFLILKLAFNQALDAVRKRVGTVKCPLTQLPLSRDDMQSALLFKNIIIVAAHSAIVPDNEQEFFEKDEKNKKSTPKPLTETLFALYKKLSNEEIEEAKNVMRGRPIPTRREGELIKAVLTDQQLALLEELGIKFNKIEKKEEKESDALLDYEALCKGLQYLSAFDGLEEDIKKGVFRGVQFFDSLEEDDEPINPVYFADHPFAPARKRVFHLPFLLKHYDVIKSEVNSADAPDAPLSMDDFTFTASPLNPWEVQMHMRPEGWDRAAQRMRRNSLRNQFGRKGTFPCPYTKETLNIDGIQKFLPILLFKNIFIVAAKLAIVSGKNKEEFFKEAKAKPQTQLLIKLYNQLPKEEIEAARRIIEGEPLSLWQEEETIPLLPADINILNHLPPLSPDTYKKLIDDKEPISLSYDQLSALVRSLTPKTELLPKSIKSLVGLGLLVLSPKQGELLKKNLPIKLEPGQTLTIPLPCRHVKLLVKQELLLLSEQQSKLLEKDETIPLQIEQIKKPVEGGLVQLTPKPYKIKILSKPESILTVQQIELLKKWGINFHKPEKKEEEEKKVDIKPKKEEKKLEIKPKPEKEEEAAEALPSSSVTDFSITELPTQIVVHLSMAEKYEREGQLELAQREYQCANQLRSILEEQEHIALTQLAREEAARRAPAEGTRPVERETREGTTREAAERERVESERRKKEERERAERERREKEEADRRAAEEARRAASKVTGRESLQRRRV